MKKILIILVSAALALSACSKKDDAENNGGNGNGNGGGNGGTTEPFTIEVKASDIVVRGTAPEIDEVRLYGYDINDKEILLATTNFNEGFKLEFPETVSNSFLRKTESILELEDDKEGEIKISKPDVLISENGAFFIECYYDGEYVGDLELVYMDDRTDCLVDFLYSSDDVMITGNSTYSEEWGSDKSFYNMDIKKGWNQVAMTDKEISEDLYEYHVTTTIPSNVKWHLYHDDYQGYSAKARSPHFFIADQR